MYRNSLNEQILSFTPENAEISFKEGLRQFQTGNYRLAREYLLLSLKFGCENLEAETLLGYIFLAEGRLVQAEASFKEALRNKPEEIPAKLGLGEVYRDWGELYRAEDCFRAALLSDSKNGKAWCNLGHLYIGNGDKERAKSYFRNGMGYGSNEARFNYAVMLMNEDESEEAEEVLRPLLDSEEYRIEAMLNLGYLLLDLGRFDESVEYLTEAEKLLDDELKMNYSAGLAHLYNSRYDKAAECFEKALFLNPRYFPAQNALQTCKSRMFLTKDTVWTFNGENFVGQDKIQFARAKTHPQMMPLPLVSAGEEVEVSIIISAAYDGPDLEITINRCLLLDYPKFEVIVLPHRYIRRERRGVRVHPTGKVDGWMKRNLGAKIARGNILVFLEAGAAPERNWLNESIAAFIDEKVLAIGSERPFWNFFSRKEYYTKVKSYSIDSDSLQKLILTTCRAHSKRDLGSHILASLANVSSLPIFHAILKKLNVVIRQDQEGVFAKIRLKQMFGFTEGTIPQTFIEPRFGDIGASN